MQLSVREIAGSINASYKGDGEKLIHGISSITSPVPGTILYADRKQLLRNIKNLADYAVIIADLPDIDEGNFIVHPHPRIAFSFVSSQFNTPYWMDYTGINPDAHIEHGTQLAPSAVICAGSFIGAGSIIGENSRILPGVYVGRNVIIGDDCVFLPGAVVLDGVLIGNRVIINSNAVVGSEGFGFSEYKGALVKMPQTGGVIIGDDVEIGAGTCIDRGTIDNTVIGSGTKLDNLVQIAHNVEIGRNVRIASQAGLTGRVHVDDNVIIGGQAGFQPGITIGKGSQVAGQSGVFKSVSENQAVSGYPAMPHNAALKQLALLRQLPDILKRIKTLEAKLEALQKSKKEHESNL